MTDLLLILAESLPLGTEKLAHFSESSIGVLLLDDRLETRWSGSGRSGRRDKQCVMSGECEGNDKDTAGWGEKRTSGESRSEPAAADEQQARLTLCSLQKIMYADWFFLGALG